MTYLIGGLALILSLVALLVIGVALAYAFWPRTPRPAQAVLREVQAPAPGLIAAGFVEGLKRADATMQERAAEGAKDVALGWMLNATPAAPVTQTPAVGQAPLPK